MKIYETLREDHDKQRTLARLLVKTHGDSQGRNELFERLRAEVDAHARAEERYFYVPLMQRDLTQKKGRHSVAEHQEIDDLFSELGATDMTSSGWVHTAEKLKERLIHHLDEEEHEVFQMAGKVLDDVEQQRLAEQYRQMMYACKQAA